MSERDRARWNERHADQPRDFTPARSLTALAESLAPRASEARALDFACGIGGNALYLAQLGYRVDAWDVSDAALAILQAELDRRRSAGASLAVNPRRVELDAAASVEGPITAGLYDLVLDFYYLERARFPAISAALRPGGLLLFETFLDAGRARERVSNSAYRLAPGELPRAFADLEVVDYLEDEAEGIAPVRSTFKMPAGGAATSLIVCSGGIRFNPCCQPSLADPSSAGA